MIALGDTDSLTYEKSDLSEIVQASPAAILTKLRYPDASLVIAILWVQRDYHVDKNADVIYTASSRCKTGPVEPHHIHHSVSISSSMMMLVRCSSSENAITFPLSRAAQRCMRAVWESSSRYWWSVIRRCAKRLVPDKWFRLNCHSGYATPILHGQRNPPYIVIHIAREARSQGFVVKRPSLICVAFGDTLT